MFNVQIFLNVVKHGVMWGVRTTPQHGVLTLHVTSCFAMSKKI